MTDERDGCPDCGDIDHHGCGDKQSDVPIVWDDCQQDLARPEPRRVQDGRLRCDALWCSEWHPLEHEELGQPSFGTGRWLGWLYLDINRPDLIGRPLRFCSVACCTWWMGNQTMLRGPRQLTSLDKALRAPLDEVAARRAGLTATREATP